MPAGAQVDLVERLRAVELIAVDLDGTLLNANKRVSARTLEAIDAVARVGVRVVPATGRVLSVLPDDVLGVLGMDYAVLCAGATVARLGADHAECDLLHATGFRPEDAAEIVAELKERYGTRIHIDVGCAEELYAGSSCYKRIATFDLPAKQIAFIRETRRWVPSLVDAIRAFDAPVGRINLFAADAVVRLEVMDWLKSRERFELANSLQNNIEINAPGTSKWRGLMWLCKHERIPSDRVMTLGDGANDVDMLRRAWLGVAMANASPEAKAAAVAVTRCPHDEDGVACVLEELARLRCCK